MSSFYKSDLGVLYFSECLKLLKTFPDNYFASIVTDPPYGIKFMGKKWDYKVPSVEIWEECLRVLKPGGFILSFAGTRTQHRMAVNIEDAGFKIRDMIAWVYGSGFPKSLDIGKAIDKREEVERKVVGKGKSGKTAIWQEGGMGDFDLTIPATEEAIQWDGWGTALKPALEPITVARKPLSEGTVANNVLKWGTGGINIDGCRVELNGGYKCRANGRPSQTGLGDNYKPYDANQPDTKGRWPANLIHDGSDGVLELFPDSKGQKNGGSSIRNSKRIEEYWAFGGGGFKQGRSTVFYDDNGSAARFFYCAKSSKKERNMGLDGLEEKQIPYQDYRENVNTTKSYVSEYPDGSQRPMNINKNNHPTVKPLALMKYLVKLVTPPNGIVLDPFIGSGTTGMACEELKFKWVGVGIEREHDNCVISKERIKHIVFEMNRTLFNL